jgi:hypothetical protein
MLATLVNHLHVELIKKEIDALERGEKVIGKVSCAGFEQTLPIKVWLSKNWGAYGLPKKACYEDKASYRVVIPRQFLPKLKNDEQIGTDFRTPNVLLRYVSIGSQKASGF